MNSGRGNRYQGRAINPRPEGEKAAGLQRRTELRRTSEARAAERPKSTSTLKAPRPAPRPKEGPMDPGEWKTHCGERAGWRCEVTGEALAWDWDAHHVIPKGKLRDAGLHAYVWHPANSMALQNAVHAAHTGHSKLVPASALKSHHLDFARALDALGDTEEWSLYLERNYPQEGTNARAA